MRPISRVALALFILIFGLRAVSASTLTGLANPNEFSLTASFTGGVGTYTVTNDMVVMHVDGGTWPGWYGSDLERRIISFSGSELKWIDPTPSVGGKIENVWKRAR